MSKNQLKFLTDDFCNLVNLKHLDLYNNQLENLPVPFGKLTKLRYLDLKGNPLQPALQKIVGPCLTTKDCLDAAKQVVPFMSDLEIKILAEKKKREEEEENRKEQEALELREQNRLAKKAARKERVMRERQEKAVLEKLEIPEKLPTTNTKVQSEVSVQKLPSQQSISASANFFSFLKTFVSVAFFFTMIFFALFKFLPKQSNQVLSLLPKHQQVFFQNSYEKVNLMIMNVFKKVLNFYKM